MKKRQYHLKTTSQVAWLREHLPYMERGECIDAFEEEFGVRLKRSSINSWASDNGYSRIYGRPEGRLSDLVDEAREEGFTASDLSSAAGRSIGYLSVMMKASSRITPVAALRLEETSGIKAERWIEASYYDYTKKKLKSDLTELKRLREDGDENAAWIATRGRRS